MLDLYVVLKPVQKAEADSYRLKAEVLPAETYGKPAKDPKVGCFFPKRP